MGLPKIVTIEEWRAARLELLDEEKAMTRSRDQLNARRRELPMVEVGTSYVFRGAEGEASLLDLFDGHRQLIVVHFMFDPRWEKGCPSCSASADEISPGLIDHLQACDTTLVHVSRAPFEKLERCRKRKGWPLAWYSSHDSRFNYDFQVTLDERVAAPEYNYRSLEEHRQAGTGYYFEGDPPVEAPGISCFLRDGTRVFHTYSTFGRGTEATGGAYYWLDLTTLGRQEPREERKSAPVLSESSPDFAA